MTWKTILKEEWKGLPRHWLPRKLSETIRVGDYIEVLRIGGKKLSGEITKIMIALDNDDVDGSYPSAVEIDNYDLRLGYSGSVHFGNTFAYFDEIKKVGRD